MIKLTYYIQCEARPDWRFLRNELYLHGFDAMQLTDMPSQFASFAGVMRSILKQGFNLMFATFERCDASGVVGAQTDAYATVFSSYDTRGTVPLNGPLFYRDVARVNLYSNAGRVGHLWMRGCVDDSDVIKLPGNKRASPRVNGLADAIRDWSYAYSCPVFNSLAFVQSGALVPATEPLLTFYTDSHSQTRWRRRLQGAVFDCGASILSILQSMFRAVENARYWQSLGARISPGATWSGLVAALSAGNAGKEALKSAMEAPKFSGGANAEPPILRFGPTWVEMLTAWGFAVEIGKKALEELLKAYPPHYESGDRYITTSFLANYIDALDEILRKVTFSANADWFNPKSYPGQVPPLALKRQLDIIELAF